MDITNNIPQIPVAYVGTTSDYSTYSSPANSMLSDTTYYTYVTDGDNARVLKTVDKGSTWTEIFTHTDAGNITSVQSLKFVTESVGVVTVNHTDLSTPAVYVTTDGGDNWYAIATATFTNATKISDLDFGDTGDSLWFVTSDSGGVYSRAIYKVTTATLVVAQQSTYDSKLNGTLSPGASITMYSDTIGFSLAIFGVSPVAYLYYTNDGGSSWASIISEAGIGAVLGSSVSPTDFGKYYASTALGIYKYDADLATFSVVNSTVTSSYGIKAFNNTTGYVASSDGKIYRTTDGFVTLVEDYEVTTISIPLICSFDSYGLGFFMLGDSVIGTAPNNVYQYLQLDDASLLSSDEDDFLLTLKNAYAEFSRQINDKAYLGGSKTSDRLKLAVLTSYYEMILDWFYSVGSSDTNFMTASEIWDVIQKFNDICNTALYINIGQ